MISIWIRIFREQKQYHSPFPLIPFKIQQELLLSNTFQNIKISATLSTSYGFILPFLNKKGQWHYLKYFTAFLYITLERLTHVIVRTIHQTGFLHFESYLRKWSMSDAAQDNMAL